MADSPVKSKGLAFNPIVLLLLVAAFVIGVFWTKNKNLEQQLAQQPKSANPPANDRPSASPAPKSKSLFQVAGDLGLDKAQLKSCLDSGKFAQKVNDHQQSGQKAGIAGTPGSILLDTQTGKTQLVSGAVPIDQLKTSIDQMLAGSAGDNSIQVKPVTDDDWVRGSRDARIMLIEYSDIDCPFCKRFHPTLKQVIDSYDDQVAWVYRHFPLPQLHPNAPKKAEATECAGEQQGNEAFWKLLDKLFETKVTLD